MPRFPWAHLIGWAVLYVFGGVFVYRLSETGGMVSTHACLAAIGVSATAAAGGITILYKIWGRELTWVILGIFISGLIRLLIGLLGVIIITLFTAIHRTQFVGYLALFYSAFLVPDLWLALRLLRQTPRNTNDQESVVHGNMWDIIVRSQSSARGRQ